MENVMRYLSALHYLARTFTTGTVAALVLAGCAQHAYLSGASYSGATNVQQYSDDWFTAARAGRTDILQALIDARFPLETRTPAGYTGRFQE
jgi:outer membrane lipoprotein SlyB